MLRMKKPLKYVAALAATVLACASAQATTTNLGAAVVGTPLSFGGLAAPGAFNDVFTFTLPVNGGSGYSVTNFGLLPNQYSTVFSTCLLYTSPSPRD